jgi:NADPH2:quinone reductase
VNSVFAVGLTEFGGPEVLHVVELPDPEPAAGEVRIRVHAVGVNPTDSTFRTGGLAARLADRTPPYIPGIDVAGVIEELGENTHSRLSIGDPVIACVIPFGVHGGTYAERIVADQRSVVRAPADVTFAEASTLLLNSVTAHLALAALGAQSGEVIAITGAAGAVRGMRRSSPRARG